ncbi:hypothetical protein Tco_1538486 [Tanacetum coccineum]
MFINTTTPDGHVDPVDVIKLKRVVLHSLVVVSVFAKIENEWYNRMALLNAFSGELIGFGRSVCDGALTAFVYNVMVSNTILKDSARSVFKKKEEGRHYNINIWSMLKKSYDDLGKRDLSRVEERLTIKLVKGRKVEKIVTIMTKNGVVTRYPRKFHEYQLSNKEKQIERMMIYWEQVEYEVSDDDDDSDLKSTARSVPKDYELEDTGTDISEIIRKPAKTGKHGHENQRSTKRSQRIKAEARKLKP